MSADLRLKGKNVLVMGLGVFTGGLATVRFLAKHGANVTVTDMKEAGKLGDAPREAEKLGAKLRLGTHDEKDFREAQIVILNPAVKPGSPLVAAAEAAGAWVTTEMALFFRLCPAKIVGITGSNGKSTTTALTGHMLKTAGFDTIIGGNIGESLIDRVDDIRPEQVVVVELSSFQLARLAAEQRSPDVAVVTNLSPNHLDWHGSFWSYCAAKANILRFQSSSQFKVVNFDDEPSGWLCDVGEGRLLGFSLDKKLEQGAYAEGDKLVLRIGDEVETLDVLKRIPLPGRHNVANVLAAAAAARAAGASLEGIREAISTFKPLPHRLETVAVVGGVRYVNDSVATTPESSELGLDSFDQPIVIIAGGYDKKVSLDSFARAIARRAKAAVLIGQTAPQLEKVIRENRRHGNGPAVVMAGTFEEAFESARSLAASGDVVLLSPGCASYGLFNNFVERGETFRSLALRLQDD